MVFHELALSPTLFEIFAVSLIGLNTDVSCRHRKTSDQAVTLNPLISIKQMETLEFHKSASGVTK